MIELSKIRIDGGTQARAELNQDVVSEYAEAYRTGVQMPPVIVFYDGSEFWLADGFHRYFGAKQAERSDIYEERIPGTRRDAVLHSLSANAKHGLRRSNADKRRAVETLLTDSEWATWSDNAIAKACAVSHHTVGSIRQPILANSKIEIVRKVERNGKTYEMSTAGIGTKPAHVKPATLATAKPDPAPVVEPVGQSELEELRDRMAEMAVSLKEAVTDNESMGRVFDADDKLAAATAEIKRLTALVGVIESRLTGQTNELNEAKRLVQQWKRRAERAEAELPKEAA